MIAAIIAAMLVVIVAAGEEEETWVMELGPDVDPYEFAEKYQLHFVDTFLPCFHVFQGQFSRARRDAVVWAEEQVPQQRYPRQVMLQDDPLASAQWHLEAERGVGPLTGERGGEGIVIAIVDDGLQHTHPELAANYAAHLSWNYNGGPHGSHDPTPVARTAGHGTAAAAVAVAVEHNGHCGRGVAPKAKVAGMRLIAEPVSDLVEAQALSKHGESIHIYSNSWGPIDDGLGIDGPGRLVRELLAHNPHGRIYVWASGNGRGHQDNCAFDGYAGNAYVNAIGAVDYNGEQAHYSEGCSNLLAVAPSSGSSMRGIVTADLMGAAGYDATECTRTFGGTSSAAPLAAGMFALLLEARPDFTWRDIRHVVAAAGIRHGDACAANAAGFCHSNALGFGALKMQALLNAAANHTLVPQPQLQVVLPKIVGGTTPLTFTIRQSNITFTENAIVRIWLHCPSASGGRGSVILQLRSPAGTLSTIAEPRPGDREERYPADGWSFSSLAFWGERADGDWQLIASGCPLTIQGVVFGVFGY